MRLIVFGFIIIISSFLNDLFVQGAPVQRSDPVVWALNLAELPGQHTIPISRNRYNKRQSDEEEEPGFRDAVTRYGRNRWNNFRNSFTEFWDIIKAGGRGVRGWFVTDNGNEE